MSLVVRVVLDVSSLVIPVAPVTPVYIAKRPIIVPVKVVMACYCLSGRLAPERWSRAEQSLFFCMVIVQVLLHSDDAIMPAIIPISPE